MVDWVVFGVELKINKNTWVVVPVFLGYTAQMATNKIVG
jgi:hypothetical protein